MHASVCEHHASSSNVSRTLIYKFDETLTLTNTVVTVLLTLHRSLVWICSKITHIYMEVNAEEPTDHACAQPVCKCQQIWCFHASHTHTQRCLSHFNMYDWAAWPSANCSMSDFPPKPSVMLLHTDMSLHKALCRVCARLCNCFLCSFGVYEYTDIFSLPIA